MKILTKSENKIYYLADNKKSVVMELQRILFSVTYDLFLVIIDGTRASLYTKQGHFLVLIVVIPIHVFRKLLGTPQIHDIHIIEL